MSTSFCSARTTDADCDLSLDFADLPPADELLLRFLPLLEPFLAFYFSKKNKHIN